MNNLQTEINFYKPEYLKQDIKINNHDVNTEDFGNRVQVIKNINFNIGDDLQFNIIYIYNENFETNISKVYIKIIINDFYTTEFEDYTNLDIIDRFRKLHFNMKVNLQPLYHKNSNYESFVKWIGNLLYILDQCFN